MTVELLGLDRDNKPKIVWESTIKVSIFIVMKIIENLLTVELLVWFHDSSNGGNLKTGGKKEV